MSIQQMQARYDEIDAELQAIHDELAARVPKPSEAEMEAAQAALVAERTRLRREYAAVKQRNDLTGTRVYDKINNRYAVVTRITRCHDGDVIHIRFDDGYEMAQWPRNLEEAAPEDGCPRCGERRVNWLVWSADGASVVCHSCAQEYMPRE